MHELSVASSIAGKVMAFAEEHSSAHVLRVQLAVGEMTSLQSEQLTFCYQAITHETPIADSALEIEPVATVINCSACRYTGRPKYWKDAQWHNSIPTLTCPECGATAEAIQGHECSIRNITYAH